MMFGVAAVVLIPTKDLPAVLRTAGKYWGDAQRMARDFRGQLTEALRDNELTSLKDSVTKEFEDIHKAADLSNEAGKFNASITAAAATAGSQPSPQPTGQIIPQAGAMVPAVTAIAETDAGAFGSGVTVPMQPLTVAAPAVAEPAVNGHGANGSRGAERVEGIEIVRAGRGSVAQRAKAAWKKSAGNLDGGA